MLHLELEAVNENTSSDRLYELAQISTELAQLVAKNLCATPELLRELGNNSDATTRQHVAANPNTPTEMLLKLGNEFPKQVVSNPVLPLLFLENPKILDQLFQPNSLWQIVLDAQTSTEVLRMLAHYKDTQIAEAAQLHVNLAGEMTQRWDEAAYKAIQTTAFNDNEREKAQKLAYKGLIPALIIEQLARHQNKRIRSLVATSPDAPLKLLEQLAQDWDNTIRQRVAQNPSASLKLLKQLAHDKDNWVRRSVASNPSTSVEILEQLAQDRNNEVRGDVALHPNTPAALLKQLAQENAYFIRMYVASNPNTPVQLLQQLAQDGQYCVRMYVANNPNTPVQVLEQLAQDDNHEVRRNALSNPKIPVQSLGSLVQDSNVPEAVTYNVNTLSLEAMLKACAKNPAPCLLRFLVLLHHQAPAQALAENFCSHAWLERYAIAQNPKTRPNTLAALAVDANRIVRAAARANLQSRLKPA
ncbi:MAG: HEAT repeat domain-containing protein [Cyanobacteriota bacterium]